MRRAAQRLLKRYVCGFHVCSAPAEHRLPRRQLSLLLSCCARGAADRTKHALCCVSDSARTHEQHSSAAAFECLTAHSTRHRWKLRTQSDRRRGDCSGGKGLRL